MKIPPSIAQWVMEVRKPSHHDKVQSGLSRVGNVRLAGWGPRGPSYLWLETLSDMACPHSQWHSCTFSLALSFRDTLTTYLSLNFSH